MIVGITGGIGSGKSTIIKFFLEFDNIAVYIADDEAKKLMNSSEEIKNKLIAEFSEEVYKNGKIDRVFLANIVFNDKQKLSILNSIVHPVVHQHFKNFVTKNKDKDYILYENAILFETGSSEFCDKIITVIAPKKDKIKRVIKRDNTSCEEVENRIKNQWSDTKKIIQSHYIIENEDLSLTKLKVAKIHNSLKNLISNDL